MKPGTPFGWLTAMLIVSFAAAAAAQNDVTGTCADFNDHRQTTGVTDVNGVAHPGYSGWTYTKVTYAYQYSYTVEPSKRKLYCACNQKTYDVLATCQKQCKASLGCFTGICEPRESDPGQVCITATLKATPRQFAVAATPARLNWKPASKPGKSCAKEIKGWVSRTNAHEAAHVKDARDVVADHNKQWAGKKHAYKGCGATQADADKEVKRMIEEELSGEVKAIDDRINANAERFHSTPAGALITDIDCGICN